MSWSAKITREEMAQALCADLLKKFRTLNSMPQDRVKNIAEGLIDGLKGVVFEYPNAPTIPAFRKSMEPDYCSGHEVGTTWRKIANEWEQK